MIYTDPWFYFTLVLLLQILEKTEVADSGLLDRDLMDIVFTLAKAGYPQYVENIMVKMRCDRGYIPGNIFRKAPKFCWLNSHALLC